MRKTLTILIFTLICLLSGCTKPAPKEDLGETVIEGFRLHSFLQNNMVLQRDSDCTLWGTATQGVKVFAKPSWTDDRYEGQAGTDGVWEIILPVPSVIEGNPAQTIKVYNGTDEILLENLLIGDVWILGGQSNMAISLNQSENAKAEIAKADHPLMRYYQIDQSGSTNPVFDWKSVIRGHKWMSVTPYNANGVSAVGYYFAKEIIAQTGVPIGIINTSKGSAPIKPYIPEADFEADKVLVENFTKNESGVFYNSMVYPIQRIACKGFLWYQGESDWLKWEYYDRAQLTLMESWRKVFNCSDDAPFYYVQLTPYGNGKRWDYSNVFYESGQIEGYALMREAQARVRMKDSNTGMAVTMDIGDLDDIHPKKKAQVGQRLARLALNKDYGRSDVECMGPVYKSMHLENGILKLQFDNAEGLRTNNNLDPVHFYVSAGDAVYSEAAAEIQGEEVWLRSELISASTSVDNLTVRYAFLYAAQTNLENSSSLPAEPFRTDTWDSVTYIH